MMATDVKKTMYRHIHFADVTRNEEHTTWECRNNKNSAPLGGIFWYATRKKYCFIAERACILDETCLADVIHFLGQLK